MPSSRDLETKNVPRSHFPTLDAIMRRYQAEMRAEYLRLTRAARAKPAARLATRATTPVAPRGKPPTARLAIEGARVGRRSGARVNGVLVSLQDGVFVYVLRLVLACSRERGAWSTKAELGIGNRPWMTSRVRRVLRGLLPPGLDPIEADRRERFRLNPALVVERVDVEELARHPDDVVRRLVAEWRGEGKAR